VIICQSFVQMKCEFVVTVSLVMRYNLHLSVGNFALIDLYEYLLNYLFIDDDDDDDDDDKWICM